MMNENEKLKMYGVRGNSGLESKPFERFFKSEQARDKWVEKNKENISVDSFCSPE